MNTGERLREQRNKAGLTQGQVETYEGITKQYLSDLERGRNDPNVWSLIARLAKRYHCSTDYLLGLTDDPSPTGQASEIQRIYDRLSPERQRDVLYIADNWLREESTAYQDEVLIKLIEDHEGDEFTRELLDELLKRLRGDE